MGFQSKKELIVVGDKVLILPESDQERTEHGLYLPLIRDYPGSPPGGHFRLTLSSVHTDQDITRLLEAVALSCE